MLDYTKTILTPEGKLKMEQELEALRAERPAVVNEVNIARGLGDLKENGAYQANKEKMRNIDRRITHLELMLRRSTVIEKTDSAEVQLGSKIVVEYNEKKFNYQIVGENEANPREGKISLRSPLGQAFLGQRLYATVKVNTPSGLNAYKIVKID